MSLQPEIEARIADWRGYLRRRRAISATDLDELEDHLRSRIDERRGRCRHQLLVDAHVASSADASYLEVSDPSSSRYAPGRECAGNTCWQGVVRLDTTSLNF